MEGKNIKVYGTLINQTQNTEDSMRDSKHNDLIAVAYQLFDERFDPKKGSGTNGAVINIDRYQDIINKRLTAIDYDPNGDITNIYSNLYVDGDTNIGGDLTVEGDTTFEGDVNITGDINLDIGLNDLNDVTLSTMAIGQVLRYNGSKWANAKLSIDDLEMPAATAGQVLKFNGTKWVADTDETGGGGATKLSELSDVDSSVDNAADGSVLKYDESAGKWKAVDESGTPSSDGYIYRTQIAHLNKVKSMFVGVEDSSSSVMPSSTFGTIYPNNRYRDVYVSNDIVLENGEQIYTCLINEMPSERGQMIYNSGVSIDDGIGAWTMTGNGQSYTWSSNSQGYAISPGTRKNTTPIKAYATSLNVLQGNMYNPDINVYTIVFNNGSNAPNFTTNQNYDPALDTSLRSTKHILVFTSGQSQEVQSQSNYKAAIKNTWTFACEIQANKTLVQYVVMPTGYKENVSSTHPYDWLTTDFYKVIDRDDRSGRDYTSISEADAVARMTFIDVPYGQCWTSFAYDKSCITMPNSIAIKVTTRKRAS